MTEFLNSLDTMEKMFLGAAVIGGSLFSVRLILLLFGADHHDIDSPGADIGDGDVAVDHGSVDSTDSDVSFKLLSFQGLTAFFMMFGLVGLGLRRDAAAGNLLSLLGATIAGVLSMAAVAKLMTLMLGLQSSGTLDMNDAIGREGKVYLTIPPGGTGKVEIIIQNRLMVLDAVSSADEEIKTDSIVEVERVLAGEKLQVSKLG